MSSAQTVAVTMHWVVAALISALFLGVYEMCTKHAVKDNAVVPVLFFSTLTGATVWGGLFLIHGISPTTLPAALITDRLTGFQHLQLMLKSAIVTASWIFTYFGLKHLPLSLGSPIRAMSPLVVLVGALAILGERLSLVELAGVMVTIVSFVGLSFVGRSEGIHFHRNKWVWFLAAGTVLGGTSALYDRYLLGMARFSVPTVQAWFSIYLFVFFTPFMVGWQRRWWLRNEFRWRWSIPAIAAALLVSDYIYFGALTDPDALVAVVMCLRRASTLVAFAGGLVLFREEAGFGKLVAVAGIVIGIVITVLG